MTELNFKTINPSGIKDVKVYPDPWLGISFLCVLFFVLFFSNVRIRLVHSAVGILLLALISITLYKVLDVSKIIDVARLLHVYMNQAFYGMVGIISFIIWLLVVLVLDKITYWEFTPGRMWERHLFGQDEGKGFDTPDMPVKHQPIDLFRHKILGLAFLGLGTGDFICTPKGREAGPIVFENVWRLGRKLPHVERLVGIAIRAK
jgi:hypothetical protein